ncbi:choice-of-anchor I family protein [Synechococcus sp. BA-132 BA5]|uniref:choice-of-anchor I family protein n=1 Tax=Synechococcus sp. BA-132 BA5 TaxID=3110252 RepID=UPI002B1F20C8|nr:choice-of-anchor I family protein [Synechococcus sp. BA-132 BA5]MEA5417412.1 choice-of-anchor I family protein [Synechococcus sp. BA-132 BA5]
MPKGEPKVPAGTPLGFAGSQQPSFSIDREDDGDDDGFGGRGRGRDDDRGGRGKPPAPANPLLASIDLSPTPPAPGTAPTEQFQTEISAYANVGGKLFILSSGGGSTLQVTDASNPSAPGAPQRVPFGPYNSQSVATHDDLVAVALSPSDYATNAGKGLVRFYRIDKSGALTLVKDVAVGYLPDGIAFTDDGKKLVIANEGEPIANYAIDRPGSIGIIDIKGKQGKETFTYTDLGFAGLTLPTGIRISGPAGTTQATDIEPEYVSILGNTAYVTLQENNGVAKVNLKTNKIETIFALGSVDFNTQLVDITDRDGAGNTPLIKPVLGNNVAGLRMADGVAAFSTKGKDYFITANEGDGREYGTYLDETRRNTGLSSRLKTLSEDTTAPFTAFGSRSVSIFDAKTGSLVWDSGNTLQTIAIAAGVYDDTRSDDKGVEPEGVVVKQLNGRTYAIVSAERGTSSLLAVFDITQPAQASFVTSTVLAGSVSPEGLLVIDATDSPTKRDLLVVSNEVSNTLNILDLGALIAAPPVAGAGTFTATMLKDVAGGAELSISSLITNGEFTNGTAPGSVYVPPGIFDGQGAYSNGDGTYTLLVNHEVGASAGYAYTAEGLNASVTGSRISRLIVDIDADDKASNGFQSRILSGGLAYDKVIGDDPNGFDRFCSANLVEANSFGAGRGFADRIFLTGEEVFGGAGGSFYALDTANSDLHQVKAFGKGTWESATVIDTGSANTVAVLLFDDAKAPLRLWVGAKTAGGFLERNGLAEANGSLYTFVPTALAETGADATAGPDSDDLKALALGSPLAGSWVKIEKPADKASYADLSDAEIRTLANDLGALQLSRIEDGEVNPLNGQQAAFVSTGTKDFSSGDLYGNVYTLSFTDAFGADGRLASTGASSLRVIYDADRLADPTTGLRNPDNLTWSADGSLYLQEDRANGGGLDITNGNFGTQEASIWKLNPSGPIDPITGVPAERWAQIDRTAVPTAYGQSQPGVVTDPSTNGVGNWESSGIIDVSRIYGTAPGSMFLANVQAHSLGGGNIQGSGYLVEGGQIDLIRQSVPQI